jgi:hypothetical protein
MKYILEMLEMLIGPTLLLLLLLAILIVSVVILSIKAHRAEVSFCEKHFPTEVHECLWTDRYKIYKQ